MKNFIKKNINSDLIHTGLNQLWRLVSGPLVLVLISMYLTAEEQGYWYTFSSLAALAVLADLGFSTIILQFAAHEFAYLKFDVMGKIAGDIAHVNKLSTLFLFSVKWVICVVLVAFPIILGIGYYILSKKTTGVEWVIPWNVYGIGSAIAFINSTILSFFEGCNLVAKVQYIRFKVAVCVVALMIVALILKLGLYALAVSLIVSSLFGTYLIYRQFGIVMKDMVTTSMKCTYSWKSEFFKLLWRYAVSWVCGYFIFQIYTPLTFQYHGVVEAGKIGISIALWNAVFNFSNIWVYINIPKLNMYASKCDWEMLDKAFMRSALYSCVTFLMGVFTILAVQAFFSGKIMVIDRFVNNTSMLFLALSWFLQVILNVLAVYLRAHKEELLVIPSIFSALYVGIATYLCAKYLSPDYLFIGYCSSYVIILPWVLYIFYKRRKKHSYEMLINDCYTNL